MQTSITLQRFHEGAWLNVAQLALAGDAALGTGVPTVMAYDLDYGIDHLDRRDAAAVSARLPVQLGPIRVAGWPAFLADLLPQGYGRAELIRRLGLTEGAGRNADWQLLLAGAGNPIGHLRVAEAAAWLAERSVAADVSFTFGEVAARSRDFLEYLSSNGLFVAGSSGVQGEWPKILLVEDAEGRLHLDHALPDARACRHWLVKFARGEDRNLARILDLEEPYMALAARLGLRVHAPLQLRERALFIPRFDRRIGPHGLERIAQESIASLCGITNIDGHVSHDRIVCELAAVATDPDAEVIEYVLRDVANVVLGNRDNHARNTALQRFDDGTIRLTPLYDFAPMMLHPDGIARRIRWANEVGGVPHWPAVIAQCQETTQRELPGLQPRLRALGEQLERLPALAEDHGIPPDILDRERLTIPKVIASLGAL
ncbi:MAG: type II toxin-antitoxin system HipA family toxin [Steroidobacteraceae bacterium]